MGDSFRGDPLTARWASIGVAVAAALLSACHEPATVSCAALQQLCDGVCTAVQSDGKNCGSCGNACGAGTMCNAGVCGAGCAQGLTACPNLGACIDLSSDPQHCGSCTVACPGGMVCANGACATACSAGTTLCGDGKCHDLQSDNADCGACGRACSVGTVCAGGTCGPTCSPGSMLCGDGKCHDLQSDNADCGACGAACSAGSVCSAGKCGPTCSPGSMLCGDGKCHDLSSDNANCGACSQPTMSTACGAGSACVKGVCSPGCASPLMLCGSQCVDARNDPSNCGRCGNVCGSGSATAYCAAMTCGLVCNPGFADCNGTNSDGCEANLAADASNCGRCGNVCPGGGACSGGTCAPATPLLLASDGVGSPSGLAVDATGAFVYWGEDAGNLHQYNTVAKTDAVLTSLGGSIRPQHLAVDSQYVYVSDENGDVLENVLIAAPNTVNVLSGANGGEGNAIAVDNNNIYWISVMGGSGGMSNVLQGTKPSFTNPISFFSKPPSTPAFPIDLVLDSTTNATVVFWVDQSAGTVNATKVGQANSNVVLVSGEPTPNAIAIDGKNLYWADTPSPTSLTIKSTPIPSTLGPIPAGNITTLFTTTSANGMVTSLVVDSKAVYWNERAVSNSSINKVALTGGPMSVVVGNRATVQTIRIGTGSGLIYWTETSNPSASANGLYAIGR